MGTRQGPCARDPPVCQYKPFLVCRPQQGPPCPRCVPPPTPRGWAWQFSWVAVTAGGDAAEKTAFAHFQEGISLQPPQHQALPPPELHQHLPTPCPPCPSPPRHSRAGSRGSHTGSVGSGPCPPHHGGAARSRQSSLSRPPPWPWGCRCSCAASWCHVPGAGRAGAPVPHGDAAGSGAAPGAGVARTGPCLSPVPPAAAPVPRRSRRWRGGDLAGPHVPTGQRLPRARSRPLPPVISLPLDVPFFLPLPPKPAGKLEGQSAPLWLLG